MTSPLVPFLKEGKGILWVYRRTILLAKAKAMPDMAEPTFAKERESFLRKASYLDFISFPFIIQVHLHQI